MGASIEHQIIAYLNVAVFNVDYRPFRWLMGDNS